MTGPKLTQAKTLLDLDYNEFEYFDHIVMENDKYYFVLVHLNGDERLLEINEVLK